MQRVVLHLYADESGNTGPDLMSGGQPLGVTAMVLVDRNQERALAITAEEAVARARYTQPREFKYSGLSKNARGRRVLQEILESVHENGARVFFSLTEKRYLAASFVVETFLDPLWTDGIPVEMLSHVERRKAANLVYQACDDDLLAEFLAACRSTERDLIAAAGERVARRLELHPSEDGPHLANAVAIGLKNPFGWNAAPDAPPRSHRPTPHTFAFLSLLSIADQFLRDTGDVAELIADEDAQFGPVLAEAFRLGRRADLFPSGVSPYGTPGPITQVRGREERRSDAEFGIQVADIVAGMIAAVAQADIAAKDLRELRGLWMALRTSLLASTPSSFWQVSERVLAKLTRSFEELVPPRDGWWWSYG